MGISIDSLDAAKHDAFRGVAGAHADTLAGIEACKRAGLDFQIHTTVLDWNEDEICDITDFAQSIGAVNHSIFFLIPVGARQVHRGDEPQGAGERGAAPRHHAQGRRGRHRRQAHLRAAVHARGQAAGHPHALHPRLPGRPHLLRRRQRGHCAPVRVHDRGRR